MCLFTKYNMLSLNILEVQMYFESYGTAQDYEKF